MASSTELFRSNALPLSRTRLFGREAELGAARALLLDEASPLLTLTGPGGVGKTSLAVTIAEDVAEEFADGVIFVDLSPLTDPVLVSPMIAGALGMIESGDRPIVKELAVFLHQRQILLLLDNCEHLLSAVADLVATLLPACPALQVLATSRIPLHVRGEREWPVPPLTLPSDASVDISDVQASAIALFVERAQAVDPRFALTEANAADVVAICRQLDGLPLAIELAAAWSKMLPPPALRRRLTDRGLGLTGGTRELPERQQTLRATIAWSYDRLPTETQRLFRHLAVFAGSFDLAAVEAIVSTADTPTNDPLSLLATLLDHSLLERGGDAATEEPRFRLLETIRAFAFEQLIAHGDEATVRAAHAKHYLTVAEAAREHLRGPAQVQWLNTLEAEHDNLRTALSWSLESQEGDVALRFGAALGQYWRIRNHIGEGLRWLEQIFHQTTGTVSEERAAALEAGWNLARQRGPLSHAAAYVDEAATIRRELGDAAGIARSLGFQGSVAQGQGDFDRAIALYEEALALTRTIGTSWHVADSLSRLASLLPFQDRLDEAEAMLEESLTDFREIGDLTRIAGVLKDLGRVATFRFDAVTAATRFEEALELNRALGDEIFTGVTLTDLAELSFRAGDLDRAEALWTEAISLFHNTGANVLEANTRWELGLVACVRGDFLEALQVANQVLAQYQALDDRYGIADTHVLFGDVYHAAGDLGLAETHMRTALTLHQDLDEPFGMGAALTVLGLVTRDQGDSKRAVAYTLEALSTIPHELTYREDMIFPLEALASILAKTQHRDHSARLLGAAQALRDQVGSVPKPAERAALERTWALLRGHPDNERVTQAYADGKAASLDVILAEAFDLMPTYTRATLIGPPTRTPTINQHPMPLAPRPFGITEREHAVLQLLCQHLTNKEIAEQLFVGARTVQTHTISIFTKLGVDNRRDAAALAVRHGLA